jgi:hypothetical protein
MVLEGNFNQVSSSHLGSTTRITLVNMIGQWGSIKCHHEPMIVIN